MMMMMSVGGGDDDDESLATSAQKAPIHFWVLPRGFF
jgi:hypothetical protein